jgi:hypothetical protein
MSLPGPNLTGTADRRVRMLPSEVLAHMARPMRKRTLEQAIKQGLRLDADARQAGFDDADAGRGWNGAAYSDIIGYARGYVEGCRARRERQ